MIANRAPSKKFALRLRSCRSHYKVYLLRPLAVSGEGQTTPKTRAEGYAALLTCPADTFRAPNPPPLLTLTHQQRLFSLRLDTRRVAKAAGASSFRLAYRRVVL